jgi:hypothetical protein
MPTGTWVIRTVVDFETSTETQIELTAGQICTLKVVAVSHICDPSHVTIT